MRLKRECAEAREGENKMVTYLVEEGLIESKRERGGGG